MCVCVCVCVRVCVCVGVGVHVWMRGYGCMCVCGCACACVAHPTFSPAFLTQGDMRGSLIVILCGQLPDNGISTWQRFHLFLRPILNVM